MQKQKNYLGLVHLSGCFIWWDKTDLNCRPTDYEFDHYLYCLRYLVENAFARLNHFCGIATRFEKLARNYNSMLFLACLFIWCKAK